METALEGVHSDSYEPEELSEIHPRACLVATAQSRKAIEKDADMLATRIRLLKIEESKAQRNVSLARAKANHIRTIRQEVALWEAERRRYDMDMQREKQMHQEKIAYMRTAEKSSRENSRQQLHKSKIRSVLEVKDFIRKVAVEKFEQEKDERERVKKRTEEIRKSRLVSHQKMVLEREERLKSIRDSHHQRLREEERLQGESEAALARLRKEEQELLDRVRTAKVIEDQIFQELKLVMPRTKPSPQNGPSSPRSHRSLVATPTPTVAANITRHD